jgi:hypothetical protein
MPTVFLAMSSLCSHSILVPFFLSFRDWVYEQSDPEKQNKVFELLESVRRWTLNSSATAVLTASGGGGNEDAIDATQINGDGRGGAKIQRSRSTLGENVGCFTGANEKEGRVSVQ